jgi:hypothetical protein
VNQRKTKQDKRLEQAANQQWKACEVKKMTRASWLRSQKRKTMYSIILDYMNIIQYTCSYIHCTYALVSWVVPGLVAFNPTWSRNTYQQKWLHMCGCDKSHVKNKLNDIEWLQIWFIYIHIYIY